MFFAKLDFLSYPPQMYYFQKRANKTIFGGLLFILYFLIMLVVTIFYLLDFYLNDRYDIVYSLYKNYTGLGEEYNKIEDLNPHLNFSFDLKKITIDLEEKDLSDNYFIVDDNFSIIERNTNINQTPSNMNFLILYICFFDCEEELENEQKDLTYVLNMTYPGYKIDHQNNKIPLEKNNDKYPFYKEFYFYFNKSTFYDVNWGLIKYREERGLLGLFDNILNKKKEYSSIDIDSIDKIHTERAIEITPKDIPTFKYNILGIIQMKNTHNQYTEYIRIKKSLLDVFANIGALFSTVFTLFSFLLNLFSKNFDNYKIIKEMLYKQRILRNNNIKIIKSKTLRLDNISKRKNNINNDNQSFDTSKSVPFKSKEINLNKKKENKKEEKLDNNYELRTINFIQFLLNNINIYSKKKKKEQEIINICNNIITKYISIELILYNQIIFENFLKDYIWKDNDLKQFVNNALIKQLHSII